MAKSDRIKLILLVLFLFIIAFVTGVMAFAGNGKKSYEVGSDYFYKENLHFFNYGDKILIISGEDDRTKATFFKSSDGTPGEILSKQETLLSADVIGDYLFISYKNGESNAKFSKISLNDYNDTKDAVEDGLEANIQNFEDFIVDNDENFYVIADKERTTIFKYISSDKYDTPIEFKCEENITWKHLCKDISGNVYALDSNGFIWKLSEGKEASKIEGQAKEETQEIKFLYDDLIITDDGCIYKFENNTLTQVFDNLANNKACAYNDGILLIKGNKLILYDKDNASVKGEASLNKEPDYITKLDGITNLDEKIACVYTEEDKLVVNIIDELSADIDYKVFDEKSDAFVTYPEFGIKYDIADFDETEDWSIALNTDKIFINNAESLILTITDLENKSVYEKTLNNGLSVKDNQGIIFSPPEKLEAHRYLVDLKNLSDKDRNPAEIKYTIEFIYNAESSSDSSQESSNSESSESGSGLIESDVYSIDRDNGYITGVAPQTTLSEFKKNLKYNGTIYISKYNGDVLRSGKVGTGAVVSLLNGDELLDSLTVIVYGDITGEGNINTRDTQAASKYFLGEEDLDDVFLKALDVNRDGGADMLDLLLINRYVEDGEEISQN